MEFLENGRRVRVLRAGRYNDMIGEVIHRRRFADEDTPNMGVDLGPVYGVVWFFEEELLNLI